MAPIKIFQLSKWLYIELLTVKVFHTLDPEMLRSGTVGFSIDHF